MRRGSKEFDKIILHYEPWIDNKRHKVAIKMSTDDGGTNVRFYTEHFKREDDERRHVENSFEKLSDLYAWIEEHLATLPDVKWEKKIYISVKGESKGSITGSQHLYGVELMHSKVSVNAEAIEIGIATDGRIWRRSPGNPKSLQRFEKNIGYGMEKESYYWKKDDPKDPGEPYSRALIDDTDENRKLLVKFSVRFDELRDQFFKAFAPEHVAKFLASTAGTFLLNAPANEPTDPCGKVCATRNEYEEGRCTLPIGHAGSCHE